MVALSAVGSVAAEILAGARSTSSAPSDQAIADWVVKTCLTFGSSVSTAYQVAGLFVRGVREGTENAKSHD